MPTLQKTCTAKTLVLRRLRKRELGKTKKNVEYGKKMHEHEIICDGDTVRIKGKFYSEDLCDLFKYYEKRGYKWLKRGDEIGGFLLSKYQE